MAISKGSNVGGGAAASASAAEQFVEVCVYARVPLPAITELCDTSVITVATETLQPSWGFRVQWTGSLMREEGDIENGTHWTVC